MSPKNWYVHLHSETIGPFALETVKIMLEQNRLQFVDFIWAPHLTKWQRIEDLDEFIKLMPEYPSAPIPASAPTISEAPPKPAKTKPAPAKKPKAEKTWNKVRRFPRVPAPAATAIIEGQGAFEVLNVSEGGIFVRATQGIAVGTELKFSLEMPSLDKKFDMTGVVIRVGSIDGCDGFAIEFTRLNPAHKRVLHDHVEQALTEAE